MPFAQSQGQKGGDTTVDGTIAIGAITGGVLDLTNNAVSFTQTVYQDGANDDSCRYYVNSSNGSMVKRMLLQSADTFTFNSIDFFPGATTTVCLIQDGGNVITAQHNPGTLELANASNFSTIEDGDSICFQRIYTQASVGTNIVMQVYAVNLEA